VDIGKLFRDAWGLFVKDIGPLIVGMLIASIVPAVAAVVILFVTIGASFAGLQTNSQGDVTGADPMSWALLIGGSVAIVVLLLFLSVPLYVGLLLGVFRRVREGREMAYGDAFSGFGMFGKVIWRRCCSASSSRPSSWPRLRSSSEARWLAPRSSSDWA
jgi:hypothetical protein